MTQIDRATELAGCPFCGGIGWLREGHRDHWRVDCIDCGANRSGWYSRTSMDDPKGNAIAAWNRRALTHKDAEITRLRAALESVISAANSFCDESGDEVASQVKLRASAALSQEPTK